MKKKLIFIVCSLMLPAGAFAQEPLRIFPSGTLYSAGEKVAVYPEGYVIESGQRLRVSGVREASVPPGTTVLSLENSDGRTALDTVRVECTPPSAVIGSARVLCLGESTTGTVNADPRTGGRELGWNWASMVAALSARDGVDIRCLGTETVSGEAAYTAHGGWSAYTYLNWPCAAKIDPHAPAHFFGPETMWYALGLRTQTGKTYSGETWQNDLLARTPFGKYPADGDASLWAFIGSVQGRYGYPEFTGKGPYKGKPGQLRQLRRWMEDLAENPVNEFYHLDSARNAASAFSLQAYLERYRTLDDRGVRLPAASDHPAGERVRGSDGKIYTVGSRIVTRELLRKVSVCTPTHVVVNIGINDGDSGTSIPCAAEGICRLMECFGDFPAAYFVNRWPGVCYKELWTPSYLPRQYAVNGNNARIMACLPLVFAWTAARPQCDALDVWHCQSPVSQLQEKYRDGVLDCSIDDVHTGYDGQMSAARQVLGWIYYRLRGLE